MKHTRTTTDRYELDESEQFTWTRSSSRFSGYEFTVVRVELENRGGTMAVYMHGPWVAPGPDVSALGVNGGWQYLSADYAADAELMQDLPLHVREQLARDGLTIERLAPQITKY